MKIAFTSVNDEEINFYRENLKEYEIKFFQKQIDDINLEEIKDVDILSVFVFDKLSKDLLSKFKNLKLIITRSAGYDHIDLDYCKEKGIKVAHMPAYSPKSIAEHTLTLILNLTRKIKKIQKRTFELNYSQEPEILAIDLDDLTAGIIGTGKIGSWTAKLLHYMGCNVIAYDIKENEDLKSLGIEYKSLDQLLEVSDIVSLHVPYTPKTLVG
jgi:D-lactate dehydrogenase